MSKLRMDGPYMLDEKTIDQRVIPGAPGNYALGKSKEKTFIVQYVGRSDDDLNERLKDWCGEGFPKFKYSYADSPDDAFEKECNNFHDFGGEEKLQNKSHPDRPNGSNAECPQCDIFD